MVGFSALFGRATIHHFQPCSVGIFTAYLNANDVGKANVINHPDGYTVRDRHLEYEKSFTRDRIRSTDTVLKANASGVRIWHKCS